MVKGISRQVILVSGTEEKLFEQAIFILKDSALGEGITQEKLMKEAQKALRGREEGKKPSAWACGPVWAAMGAAATGLAWLLTVLI